MSSDPSAKYGELLRYLNQRGTAKISDFSRDLFLSESTVRRALETLVYVNPVSTQKISSYGDKCGILIASILELPT
jgi:predicted ArsR family transcriptional regulator